MVTTFSGKVALLVALWVAVGVVLSALESIADEEKGDGSPKPDVGWTGAMKLVTAFTGSVTS